MAGTLTRPAARIATHALAECTPRTTRKILDRFGGMTPSVSTLQRLADSIHGTYQGIEEEVLSEARSREAIPKEATSVSVSLDGVMVNLRKDEHPVGTEKDSEGPAGANWREAACGAITFHDRTGRKLRTISSGQMPERNKLKLKRWLVDEFEPLMQERPDLTYVAVADGAPDNWGFLSSQNLDVEVLDFYHASTHLRKASAHALSPEIWFAKWKDILQHERGGAERVIDAIRGLCSRASTETAQKELKVELNYFRSNRYRMNYRDIKQRGLPIGSGIIEAVNKTHVGERLKKSGMRWSISGGQGILTIRSWVKSDRFDFIWSRVMAEFDNRMPVNDNHEPNQKMHKAA